MSETYEMTAEGLAGLRAEVEEMETAGRARIAAEIKTAREFGDLKENAEYHAAKEAQGMLEARINMLRERLNHAKVVEHTGGGMVTFGSTVEVRDEKTGKAMIFGSSVCSSSPEDIGRPRTTRFSAAGSLLIASAVLRSGHQLVLGVQHHQLAARLLAWDAFDDETHPEPDAGDRAAPEPAGDHLAGPVDDRGFD